MFQSLTPLPPDPILGLSIAFKADANPNKIDLGMGVYRDAYGNTPVMSAVKKAEQLILKSQSTKAYVGPVGAVDYNDTISRMVLGDALANQLEKRRMTVQTPGGTGGLRLTADFIRKVNPDATVWVSDPTWANHSPLINAAGLKIQKY
ncbi:MAG: aminotransferase class I/II-fold pyridoxal phosphate-dependent enzyme, partial [Pseudomonadota bacterium]|nr:aminotransferase class I/II-fold pyridoxal phosphate-dependent enzyme [Pseudomonadota bacterium]